MDLSLAIVRDATDPEGAGRVKVAFAGDPDAPECWASVVSPFAGRDRGLFLLPEVGDEVLVGFLGGDRRSPVVLGALWNSRDPPPTSNPRERTWQSVDGHRISLIDSGAPGQRMLLVEDAHGSRIEMRQGRMKIRAAGLLEIEGEGVTLNGKPLSAGGARGGAPPRN